MSVYSEEVVNKTFRAIQGFCITSRQTVVPFEVTDRPNEDTFASDSESVMMTAMIRQGFHVEKLGVKKENLPVITNANFSV